MSFVDDCAADAAAILGEQGIAVTYFAGGAGAGAPLTAVWDPLEQQARTYKDGRIELRGGTLETLPSATPSPSTLDTFRIGSVTFAVDAEASDAIAVSEWIVQWRLVDLVPLRHGGSESHVEKR